MALRVDMDQMMHGMTMSLTGMNGMKIGMNQLHTGIAMVMINMTKNLF